MNEMNNMEQRQPNAKLTAGVAGFFAKVYGILGIGIAISALTSYVVIDQYLYQVVSFFAYNRIAFYGIWIAEFALVIFLSTKALKNPTLAVSGFIVYSVLNGLTLSVTLAMYNINTIAYAFASAAVTYGAMAVVGTRTKKDLSGIGQAGISALIGVIIATFLNVFLLKSSPVDLLLSILIVLIFSGLTAYDHQKIKKIYYHYGEESGLSGIAVYCALTLYLDFINLFLAFLRIFGSKN